MPRKKAPLQKYIDDLSQELAEMREEVLERAGYDEFGPKEVASVHGIIGGKNNTYVDAIRGVFLFPQQFIAEWTEGALEEARVRRARTADLRSSLSKSRHTSSASVPNVPSNTTATPHLRCPQIVPKPIYYSLYP
jgi:hypothetical protein